MKAIPACAYFPDFLILSFFIGAEIQMIFRSSFFNLELFTLGSLSEYQVCYTKRNISSLFYVLSGIKKQQIIVTKETIKI